MDLQRDDSLVVLRLSETAIEIFHYLLAFAGICIWVIYGR